MRFSAKDIDTTGWDQPWTPAQRDRFTGIMRNSGTVRVRSQAAPKPAAPVDRSGWDQPWTPAQRDRINGVLARSGDRVARRERMYAPRPDGSLPEGQARDFFGPHYEAVVQESAAKDQLFGIARQMDAGRLPNGPAERLALLDLAEATFSGPKTIIPPEDLNFKAA